MELAIAALSSLLPKLGSLLSDEYKLHKGMRGDIKFLLAEMESMQAALNRVSMLPGHQIDDLVKIWVRDLKELSYDIEDSVDTFMVHVDASVCAKPQQSFRRFFDRTVRLLTRANTHHRIATDIEEIKRRIHEVAERRARYKFEDVIVQPHTIDIDPRLPALYEDAAKLVGIDGPAEKLVNILMQRESLLKQNLMVVSIVGVGGLGKTTLANSVYERLGGKFQCQALVSVSLKPNMKKILMSILWQLTKDTNIQKNAEDKDPQDLIYGIRQFLKDKRYFIVIDDVWDESTWTLIKCALTENENNLGSRVIVTTRNVEVAKLCSSRVDGTLYELDPLSEADSKRLFYKRIFYDEDGVQPELEEVSENFLKKCGGLPLAIITISSLLANKPTRSKYEWYAVYNSFGSGLHENKSMEHMRQILSLSYCDLPTYLKPCLLYLSIFPEDYKIDRGSLVRRWVAEGFIDGKHGRNAYEIGSSYFNELVNRSMIQPVDMDVSGKARACRVHDMILDLIISLSTEENFVTVSNVPELTSPLCKIRRLSLQGSEIYLLSCTSVNSEEKQLMLSITINLSHVRSLTTFGDSFKWMPPLSMFPVLRVLDLWTKSLKDLRSLHHLRYLSLGGCLEIPEGIGNLRLLKTLHLKPLRLYGTIYQLPASVVQLRQLEHLLIPTGVKLPDGIGNMTALQELSWLTVNNSPNTLAKLGNLSELRVLSIYGLINNKSHSNTFLHSLSNLGKINTLHFSGSGSCSLDCMPDPWRVPPYLQSFEGGEVIFEQLPWWFSMLSELSCLSIDVSRLRLDDLEMLGALPMLRFLQLKAHLIGSTDEPQVIVIKQSFRSLVEFQFKHYRTCWLIFAQQAMPKLQKLQLHFRAEQRGGGVDAGLQNLTSLKQLIVKIDCEDARIRKVEDMETKFRDAVDIHPNHPILELSRSYDYLMVQD